MSFADDLLDGFDNLNKRTEGGIKSIGEYSSFYKSLGKIEKEYAKSLVKLVQSQKQDFKKAGPSQKEVNTTFNAWDIILSELEKTAEHHNQFGDRLDNDLSKPMANWTKEKQKNRKKLESDSERVRKDIKAQLDTLQKTRAKYVTLSKESDAAEATHTKGKGDINMKPSQLAKVAAKASQAADKASQSDSEYQSVLTLTNQKQAEYYNSIMPALLSEFQQFEEERIQYLKETTSQFASIHAEKPSVYTNSCDSINSAASSIQVESDIKAFVNENRTGVQPPSDIPYVRYDNEAPATPSKPKPSKPPPGKIGKYAAPKAAAKDILSRDWGLSQSDMNNLSGEEQKQKLMEQLTDLDKAINSEVKSKEGLENLVRFYASDPVAQKKAEDEIVESENKMRKLTQIRGTVQSKLSDIGGDTVNGRTSVGNEKVVHVRALYDYAATCDTELTFKEGDILSVSEQDESGWWYAEIRGQAGFVPNNYVEVVR